MGMTCEISSLEEMCEAMCDNRLPEKRQRTSKIKRVEVEIPEYDMRHNRMLRSCQYGLYEVEEIRWYGSVYAVRLKGCESKRGIPYWFHMDWVHPI